MQHKRPLAAAVVAASAALAVALGMAASGSSAPQARLFTPGGALDGVRIGMTRTDVLAAWGREHGVCRDCDRLTWYFNDRPFEPQGTGVVFERGRVTHAFTVWQPSGWRTPEGMSLRDHHGRVHDLYGPLEELACDGYVAVVLAGGRVDSVFYVYRDAVWGFGLKHGRRSPCL